LLTVRFFTTAKPPFSPPGFFSPISQPRLLTISAPKKGSTKRCGIACGCEHNFTLLREQPYLVAEATNICAYENAMRDFND